MRKVCVNPISVCIIITVLMEHVRGETVAKEKFCIGDSPSRGRLVMVGVAADTRASAKV